jgi:hypothetical protein
MIFEARVSAPKMLVENYPQLKNVAVEEESWLRHFLCSTYFSPPQVLYGHGRTVCLISLLTISSRVALATRTSSLIILQKSSDVGLDIVLIYNPNILCRDATGPVDNKTRR